MNMFEQQEVLPWWAGAWWADEGDYSFFDASEPYDDGMAATPWWEQLINQGGNQQ